MTGTLNPNLSKTLHTICGLKRRCWEPTVSCTFPESSAHLTVHAVDHDVPEVVAAVTETFEPFGAHRWLLPKAFKIS